MRRRACLTSGDGNNPLWGNVIAYYPLISDSVDYKNGYNGTDTSVTYGSGAGDFQNTANYTASTSANTSIADNNDFSFGNGTTDSSFSLSFRVNWSAINTSLLISKRGSVAANDREYQVYLVTGGTTLSLRLFDQSTGGTRDINFTLSPSTGTVYWIVFTYDASANEGKAYVNGTQQIAFPYTPGDTGSYTAMENGAGNVTFAKAPYGTSNSLNGYLGEVIFFNKALSQTEIDNHIKARYDLSLPFN